MICFLCVLIPPSEFRTYGSNLANGKLLVNVIQLQPGETVSSLMSVGFLPLGAVMLCLFKLPQKSQASFAKHKVDVPSFGSPDYS